MVSALTDGFFRFRPFLRYPDRPVDWRGIRRVEVTSAPLHGRGEGLLVDRDPRDFIDRRHRGRTSSPPPLAASQPFEDVTFVSGSRAVAIRGRMALWIHAST